jgi:hypothetical protein
MEPLRLFGLLLADQCFVVVLQLLVPLFSVHISLADRRLSGCRRMRALRLEREFPALEEECAARRQGAWQVMAWRRMSLSFASRRNRGRVPMKRPIALLGNAAVLTRPREWWSAGNYEPEAGSAGAGRRRRSVGITEEGRPTRHEALSPRPPLTVSQPEGETAVVIEGRYWRRLKRRVSEMAPQSEIWLLLTGALGGTALNEWRKPVLALAFRRRGHVPLPGHPRGCQSQARRVGGHRQRNGSARWARLMRACQGIPPEFFVCAMAILTVVLTVIGVGHALLRLGRDWRRYREGN